MATMLEIGPKSRTENELINHIWTIRPIDQCNSLCSRSRTNF